MSLTSKSIRFALEITDPNIVFTEDAKLEKIEDKTALVYTADLKARPDCCPNCGLISHESLLLDSATGPHT